MEIEKIRQDIRDLKQRREQTQAERVEQGLPPSPPASFVPLAMGWTLYKRADPLIKYAVTYASLCDRSDEIINISPEQMAWIQSYEIDVMLLRNVEGGMPMLSRSIDGIHSALSNYDRFETAGELVRELAQFIKHTRGEYGEYTVETITNDVSANKDEVLAEVERLKDAEYFAEEYERLSKHYETTLCKE